MYANRQTKYVNDFFCFDRLRSNFEIIFEHINLYNYLINTRYTKV